MGCSVDIEVDGQLTVFHCLYFSCGSHSSGVGGLYDLDKEESRHLTSALARAAPFLLATISVTKTGSEVDMEERKVLTGALALADIRPVAFTPVKLMGCDTDIEESRRLILAPALGYSL
jgi:hypothetical protein